MYTSLDSHRIQSLYFLLPTRNVCWILFSRTMSMSLYWSLQAHKSSWLSLFFWIVAYDWRYFGLSSSAVTFSIWSINCITLCTEWHCGIVCDTSNLCLRIWFIVARISRLSVSVSRHQFWYFLSAAFWDVAAVFKQYTITIFWFKLIWQMLANMYLTRFCFRSFADEPYNAVSGCVDLWTISSSGVADHVFRSLAKYMMDFKSCQCFWGRHRWSLQNPRKSQLHTAAVAH